MKMHDGFQTVALPPLLCSDFIAYVLRPHQAPTTVVICSSREAFLDELRACFVDHTAGPSASPTEGSSRPWHSLLVPTLHLIAKSQSVSLVFAPTLPHLRAFLSTYSFPAKPEFSPSAMTKRGSQVPMLAIWGFARLHQSTVEHSAQGLSRTLATVVEATRTGGQKLVLAEPKERYERRNDEDANGGDERFEDPWKEQVPLLSGSVRFGGEERAWAGKTIEVGRIVAKWCNFMRLDD